MIFLILLHLAITNRYDGAAACGPAASISLPGSGGMPTRPGAVSP
jgi:hypothetical protein